MCDLGEIGVLPLGKRKNVCRQFTVRRDWGLGVNVLKTIALDVAEETAFALADDRRRAAVGRMVDRLVRPGSGDPLIACLDKIAEPATRSGFTDEELEAELAAYNSERRD